MTLHAYADAAAKATSEALSICSESPLRRLSLLPDSPATSSAVSPWKLPSTPTEREMMWDEAFPQPQCADGEQEQPYGEESHLNFDFLSLVSKPKDYYKILEVGYDATDDAIRSNYIRLALKWHPDKQKNQDDATSRFQEINEAYQVLSDPIRRMEYDQNGMQHVYDYNLIEYLNRYKGLILTCNGLGIQHSIW